MIKDWKCPYKRNRKKRKKIGEVHTVGKLGQVCNGSGGGPGLSSRNTENTVKMRQRQNKYAHNPLVHGMKEGGNSDDGIVAKKLLGQSRRHGRTTKNGEPKTLRSCNFTEHEPKKEEKTLKILSKNKNKNENYSFLYIFPFFQILVICP